MQMIMFNDESIITRVTMWSELCKFVMKDDVGWQKMNDNYESSVDEVWSLMRERERDSKERERERESILVWKKWVSSSSSLLSGKT